MLASTSEWRMGIFNSPKMEIGDVVHYLPQKSSFICEQDVCRNVDLKKYFLN